MEQVYAHTVDILGNSCTFYKMLCTIKVSKLYNITQYNLRLDQRTWE